LAIALLGSLREVTMQMRAEQLLSLFRSPPFGHEPKIRDREAGEVSVIELSGPLVRGIADQSLNGRIGDLLGRGVREFAINLSSVTDIDSSGLGGLAEAYNQVMNSGGELKFFGAPPRLTRMLQRMHLDTIFDLQPTEQSALASFRTSDQ
jgi:anti-anti-sigma factor